MDWRERPLLSWREAEAVAPVSRRELQRLARAGRLETRRLGDDEDGRVFVVTASLRRLLGDVPSEELVAQPSARARAGARRLLQRVR